VEHIDDGLLSFAIDFHQDRRDVRGGAQQANGFVPVDRTFAGEQVIVFFAVIVVDVC
jgi:hypothetical protein